jgi:hypothetical protein
MLRISGERSPSGLTTNTDWTPLRYDFDVQDLINVELVCEFRGADGRGVFDTGSLRLRRSGSARPVSEPR